MELLIRDSNSHRKLLRNPQRPRILLESFLKNLFFFVHSLIKTWTLSLMRCPSKSSSKDRKSLNKEKKAYYYTSSDQASINVWSQSVENRLTWKLINKENISGNSPWCVLFLELLQLIAQRLAFCMDSIGPPSNILLRSQRKREEKSLQPFYQKFKFWPELVLTKKSSFAIFSKKKLMALESILFEKENKAANFTWSLKESWLPKRHQRKFSSIPRVTTSVNWRWWKTFLDKQALNA